MGSPPARIERKTIAEMPATEWMYLHGLKPGSVYSRLHLEGWIVKRGKGRQVLVRWAEHAPEVVVLGRRPIAPERVPQPSPVEPTTTVLYDPARDRYLARNGPSGAFVNQLGPRVREIVGAALQHMTDPSPMQPIPLPPLALSAPASDVTVYLGITDVHFGLGDPIALGLALDQRIARNLAPVIAAHGRPRRIIIPVGSDALHVDNYHRTTTKGTAVHGELSAVEAYDHAVRWYHAAVCRLATMADEVHLVYCAGNHDRVLSAVAFRHLSALFAGERRVHLHSELRDWTTVRIGQVLWHVEHGDRRQGPTSIALMAEHPAWSACPWRVVVKGHRHHLEVKDADGAMVVQCRAMSGASQYDRQMGYASRQGVTVVVATDDEGVVGVVPG